MNTYLVAFQLLLLLPMVSIAVLSHRTSRAHRSRHGGFLGLAFLIGLASAVTAMISLAIAVGGEESVDPLLSFLTPTLTLATAALVARRGLARRSSRRERR